MIKTAPYLIVCKYCKENNSYFLKERLNQPKRNIDEYVIQKSEMKSMYNKDSYFIGVYCSNCKNKAFKIH